MMNVKTFGLRLIRFNWKNGLFRLWFVCTACVEFIAVTGVIRAAAYKNEGIEEPVFLAFVPFIILVAAVLLFKIARWILLGLTKKNDLTDNVGACINRFLSAETFLSYGKMAIGFVLRQPKKVFLVASSLAIFLAAGVAANSYWRQVDITARNDPARDSWYSWRVPATSEQKRNGKSIYKVHAPGGAIFALEGPEGGTSEEAIARIKEYQAQGAPVLPPGFILEIPEAHINREPKEPKEPPEPNEPREPN